MVTKVCAIGDLHGRDVWQKFADISILMKGEGMYTTDYDYYIFVGDYLDSFDKTGVEQIHNLKELIRFKEMYPKQVILLLGNHDIQYKNAKPFKMSNPYLCTGYNHLIHTDVYDLFKEYKNLFQMAFQIENYIFVHALITNSWYEKSFTSVFFKFMNDMNMLDNLIEYTVSERLNIAYEYMLDPIFDVGHIRGGFHMYGGPFWEDMKMVSDGLASYHQVTGHTARNDIRTHILAKDTSVTCIDVLANKKAFYSLNIKRK